MTREEQAAVLQRAVAFYGPGHQAAVAIEEMAELTKELVKHYNRGEYRAQEITEEMADVQIMLWQLAAIFQNSDGLEKAINSKLKRLVRKMEEDNG